jgi:membrane protease YdiL (CAAX protease family)
MSTIIRFVKRHPLATFFGLAYAFSWSSYLILGAPFLFPDGPFIAALIVASVTRGRGGLKEWLSRCLRWRVGLRWYAVALGLPVAITLTAMALNLLLGASVSPAAHLSPWYSFFWLFPFALLDTPLWEETAWRGFAMPRFPADRSPLVNTLLFAALFVGWHVPWALAEPSMAAPLLISAFGGAILTNWVYYNARESALLAILIHTAQNTTGGAGLNLFHIFSGADNLRVWWLFAAVYAAVAVVVVLTAGPSLGRRRAVAPLETAPTSQSLA